MRPAASGARKGHGATGARGAGAGVGAGQSQRKQGAAVKAAQQCAQPAGQAPDEEDTNAGFGKYLRSQEGIEMMKLFVIANTIVVFMTMAWPQMQQSYQILRSLLFADEEDEDDL